MTQIFRRSRPRRRGMALIEFALVLPVVLAILMGIIEMGWLVKNQLTLANAVRDGARYAALSNNSTNVIARLKNGAAQLNPAPNKIKVQATRVRSLFFAQVLGRDNGTVTRHATAGRIALRGIPRAVPLAMTTDDYYANRGGNSFEYELINNHDTDFGSGNVASLDLCSDNSGKSGSIFQEDLTNGYNGTIYIGQDINNSLNASITSQGSKLDQAMQDRMKAAAAAPYYDNGRNFTYPNYPADDPRIMVLIVALPNKASNNNPTVNAQFFVPVYIESIRSPGGKRVFLRLRVLPTLTYSSQDQMIALDSDSTAISGPSVVSLLN